MAILLKYYYVPLPAIKITDNENAIPPKKKRWRKQLQVQPVYDLRDMVYDSVTRALVVDALPSDDPESDRGASADSYLLKKLV